MKGLTVGQRYNRCALALTLFATLPVKAQEVAIGGTVTPGNSNICSQATGQTNFDCLTQTAAGGLAVLTSVSSPTAALDASATGVANCIRRIGVGCRGDLRVRGLFRRHQFDHRSVRTQDVRDLQRCNVRELSQAAAAPKEIRTTHGPRSSSSRVFGQFQHCIH
jgi:hypothetical protein